MTTPRRTTSQDELDPHDGASVRHEPIPHEDEHPTDVFQAYWDDDAVEPAHTEHPVPAAAEEPYADEPIRVDQPTARMDEHEYPTQVIAAYRDEPETGGHEQAGEPHGAEQAHGSDFYAEDSYTQDSYAPESYDQQSHADQAHGQHPYADQAHDQHPYAGESPAQESHAQEPYAQESYAQESYAAESYDQHPYADESHAQESYAAESYAQEPHDPGAHDGPVASSGGSAPSVASQLFGTYEPEIDEAEDTAIIPRITDDRPDDAVAPGASPHEGAEPGEAGVPSRAPVAGRDPDEPLTVEQPAVAAQADEPVRGVPRPSAPAGPAFSASAAAASAAAASAAAASAAAAPLIAGHAPTGPGPGPGPGPGAAEPELLAGYAADSPAARRGGVPAPERGGARALSRSPDPITASSASTPAAPGAQRTAPAEAGSSGAPRNPSATGDSPAPVQPASPEGAEPDRRQSRRERRKSARADRDDAPGGSKERPAGTATGTAAAGVATGAALAAGAAVAGGAAARGRGAEAGRRGAAEGRTEVIARDPGGAAGDRGRSDGSTGTTAEGAPPSRRPMLVGVALLVVTLLAAGGAYLAWSHTSSAGASAAGSGDSSGNLAFVDQADTAAVKNQVAAAINAIYSYDSAQLDQSESRALAFITGGYVDQFKKNFATVRQLAPKEKAALTSTVVETGVESLTQSRATLLVMVNQVGRRGDNPQPLRASVRLSVTADKLDGQWKVSGVTQK